MKDIQLEPTMDDREVWGERVRNIRADSTTWWWLLNRNSYLKPYLMVYKMHPNFSRTNQEKKQSTYIKLDDWLVGFYGILTFVGYLMPNPFLWKYSVLFQTVQFNMSSQFNCQKQFHFNQFRWIKQFYFKQFSSA